MNLFSGKGVFGVVFMGLTLIAFLSGCGSVLQEQKKEEVAVSGSQGSKTVDPPNARYYDFDDIQIPNELTKNADTGASYAPKICLPRFHLVPKLCLRTA